MAENFRISQSLARSGGRPDAVTGADDIDARVIFANEDVMKTLRG